MAHLSVTGYDANGQRVQRVGTPTTSTDAVPKSFIRYDLGNISQPGKPQPGDTWLDYAVPVAFSFPVAMAGSVALCTTAPTNAVTFNLTKNGTSFGTVNFAAGATVGTFTSASGASLAANDRLRVISPNPQDATLSDVTITLVGAR